MLPRVDLRLIADGLRQISATPYFDPGVLDYSEHLCRAIEYSLQVSPPPPDSALRLLRDWASLALQYLSGSISRESPYEVEYCLKKALTLWRKKSCLITTGLIDNPYGFCFVTADPWEIIRNTLPNFDDNDFDPALILIGVPRLYRHKPIFCIPLYHELGHFVDKHWGLSQLLTLNGMRGLYGATRYSQNYWAEYFADVFAASFVGASMVRSLEVMAPGHNASPTHPATADRIDLMSSFLSGKMDWRIEAIRAALRQVGAPQLSVRFTRPDVGSAFDDLRTYRIASEEEVHGIFDAAWAYFEDAIGRESLPWSTAKMNEGEIEKITNDLTEKSIRNYVLREQWVDVYSGS